AAAFTSCGFVGVVRALVNAIGAAVTIRIGVGQVATALAGLSLVWIVRATIVAPTATGAGGRRTRTTTAAAAGATGRSCVTPGACIASASGATSVRGTGGSRGARVGRDR